MPTIKPGMITNYIINGDKKLLNEIKEIVEKADTREDALLNTKMIECEQKSYLMMTNAKSSYVPKGIFGGGVAGLTRSLITSSEYIFTGVAAGAVLGGSAALVIDKIDDCMTKAKRDKRNEDVIQLLIAANSKFNSFKLESKPESVASLRV